MRDQWAYTLDVMVLLILFLWYFTVFLQKQQVCDI